MLFFILLSWLGILVLTCFFILAIAAGLYYLCSIVEEYTVASAKIITHLNTAVICIFVGLFIFENLPNYLILCGFISHLNHIIILRSFPFFRLSSLSFIFFIGLLIVNHYLAFSYFTSVYYHFTQVISFFTICLWLIPFAFFVSLSANDYILPTDSRINTGFNLICADENDLISHYFLLKEKRSGLLSFFNRAKGSLLPQVKPIIKKSY